MPSSALHVSSLRTCTNSLGHLRFQQVHICTGAAVTGVCSLAALVMWGCAGVSGGVTLTVLPILGIVGSSASCATLATGVAAAVTSNKSQIEAQLTIAHSSFSDFVRACAQHTSTAHLISNGASDGHLAADGTDETEQFGFAALCQLAGAGSTIYAAGTALAKPGNQMPSVIPVPPWRPENLEAWLEEHGYSHGEYTVVAGGSQAADNGAALAEQVADKAHLAHTDELVGDLQEHLTDTVIDEVHNGAAAAGRDALQDGVKQAVEEVAASAGDGGKDLIEAGSAVAETVADVASTTAEAAVGGIVCGAGAAMAAKKIRSAVRDTLASNTRSKEQEQQLLLMNEAYLKWIAALKERYSQGSMYVVTVVEPDC